jgi:hypothetical protein
VKDRGGDKQNVNTACSRHKWVPIRRTTSEGKLKDNAEMTTSTSTQKGATFAMDIIFNKKDALPAQKTPAKEAARKTVNDCFLKIILKIFHDATNVQESILGMIDLCLAKTKRHELSTRRKP